MDGDRDMSIWNLIVIAVILGVIYAFVFIPWRFSYRKLNAKGWPIALSAIVILLVYLFAFFSLFCISLQFAFLGYDNIYGIIVLLVINSISWFIINILISCVTQRQEKKNCKYCSELILINAIKCKHCGSSL